MPLVVCEMIVEPQYQFQPMRLHGLALYLILVTTALDNASVAEAALHVWGSVRDHQRS